MPSVRDDKSYVDNQSSVPGIISGMTDKPFPYTCPISMTPEGDSTRLPEHEVAEDIDEFYDTLEKPLTTDEFLTMTDERKKQIIKELDEGFRTISVFPKSVTFYGSARLKPGTEFYEKARRLGAECCKLGFGVVTGGGPGIMQAGNQGTFETCGSGIGFNIVLPFEQSINPYVSHGVNFQYFFTRKFCMNFTGEAYLCFPGGFGTLDEFFEILTLVQTKKVQKIPIILVGSEFWSPILAYSKNVLLEKFGTISEEDLELFQILDDEKEIMKIIMDAPLRDGYYN